MKANYDESRIQAPAQSPIKKKQKFTARALAEALKKGWGTTLILAHFADIETEEDIFEKVRRYNKNPREAQRKITALKNNEDVFQREQMQEASKSVKAYRENPEQFKQDCEMFAQVIRSAKPNSIGAQVAKRLETPAVPHANSVIAPKTVTMVLDEEDASMKTAEKNVPTVKIPAIAKSTVPAPEMSPEEELSKKKSILEDLKKERVEVSCELTKHIENVEGMKVELTVIQKALLELTTGIEEEVRQIENLQHRGKTLAEEEKRLNKEISELEEEISNKPIVILMSSVKELSRKKLGKMESNLEKGDYSEITSDNGTIQLIASLNWRDFPKLLKYVSWFNGFIETMETSKYYELCFSAGEESIKDIFTSIILERRLEEYFDVCDDNVN